MNKITLIFIIALLISSFCFHINAQEIKPTIEEKEWIEKGYKNAKISNFNIKEFYDGNEEFTHSIDLTLVNLKRSGWDKELIKKTIKKVADVYQQCGIKIGSVKYVESEAPDGKVDISKDEYDDYALAYDLPRKKRPVLFFIRSNTEGKTGFANPSQLEDPPVSNTAFITSNVNTSEYKKKRPDGYSPTAHELAHLLCDCLHNESRETNIMTKYYNLRTNQIKKEQCDAFKLIGVKEGLLRKI